MSPAELAKLRFQDLLLLLRSHGQTGTAKDAALQLGPSRTAKDAALQLGPSRTAKDAALQLGPLVGEESAKDKAAAASALEVYSGTPEVALRQARAKQINLSRWSFAIGTTLRVKTQKSSLEPNITAVRNLSNINNKNCSFLLMILLCNWGVATQRDTGTKNKHQKTKQTNGPTKQTERTDQTQPAHGEQGSLCDWEIRTISISDCPRVTNRIEKGKRFQAKSNANRDRKTIPSKAKCESREADDAKRRLKCCCGSSGTQKNVYGWTNY
jgi:hypothetical protein